MKLEIKQRIEQIRQGEVPEGYKKSPFGILPVDWKIKKLSDVLIKQIRKNKDNSVHNVLTNSATQGIISQTDYFDKKIANDENTNGYYLVQPGDFVYNPRISNNAPCGPFNRYNGDKNGIMSPLYTVYRFEDKSLVYSDYLSHYFLSSKWHAYMNGIANYGARSDRMNVVSEDMDNMPLPYPSSHEAQKIAEILSTQDKVIELYEKKIEQLQLLKKVCLQKMFPKQGRNVPEVRFPGFTEPWIARKLGSICRRVTRKNNNESDLPLTISSQDGLVDQRLFFNKVVAANDMSNYYLLRKGELAYNRSYSKGYDYGSIKRLNSYEQGCLSTLYICFEINDSCICSDFLQCYFDALQWYNDIMQICSEGARNHGLLNVDTKAFFENVIVKIPISMAEQERIADYLNNLDNVITLHQRQLDEEKRKKKALMQLLLTGIVRV